ncbi:DUF262 domain-containing protein [Nocardioides dongxiaopingii]|uniref:DUF262 domain-containing protein n=1 Tax=Nocardioides dongxiaopingii TaxID=2576036 RepID=UPI0014859065|nr:DUF262 domain-containing protein [Nocardioides dongxiaopingii]
MDAAKHNANHLLEGRTLRFQTSDPDLSTIIGRINRGTIDLQPNFQRGEVWSTPKKQRLIDSILRKWHIPPIHLVAKGGGRFDVLDGQQRLTALRDFFHGDFAVDGRIEPEDTAIQSFHKKKYHQLSEEIREEIGTFAIRVFELHDYSVDEPHELFFRLNQPTNLTEAEKRNAFIGGPRNQVRALVSWASEIGLVAERVGFSNSRMAYDDLLARFLLAVEQGTLQEKVTAQKITNRYRTKDEFASHIMDRARESISFVVGLEVFDSTGQGFKPNKATFHTWLCLAAKLTVLEDEELSAAARQTIDWIERNRMAHASSSSPIILAALSIFHDRATARVADVSSVVLRDLVAWIIINEQHPGVITGERAALLEEAKRRLDSTNATTDVDDGLYAFTQQVGWGGPGWI